MNVLISNHVMPAQAGIQFYPVFWIPACAGMTQPRHLREKTVRVFISDSSARRRE